MNSFSYRAKDRDGRTVTGVVEAESASQAAGIIREMGHLPMDIKPVGAAAARVRSKAAGSAFARYFVYPFWTGVNIKALALFYRQLATMLGSGMSISEALRSLAARTRGRLGAIIREALSTVEQGGTLSQTLERHPRVFGRLQLSLVRVGESSGLMEAMAERIASYLEYEISVRQMIAKSLFYPVLVLLMAFSIRVGLPNVKVALEQNVWAFLKAVWPSVWDQAAPVLVLIIVLKLVFQFDTPRLIWDAIKIQPPVVGSTARKIAMSRFCRALAVLYAAGVTLSEAVSISADACANLFVARTIRPAARAIQAGRGLTESLAATRALIPMVLDMLATGERSGSMDAVLVKVADYMDEEADATIHKVGIMLFVLAILVAAAFVLIIAVQFYSSYFGGIMKAGEGG